MTDDMYERAYWQVQKILVKLKLSDSMTVDQVRARYAAFRRTSARISAMHRMYRHRRRGRQ